MHLKDGYQKVYFSSSRLGFRRDEQPDSDILGLEWEQMTEFG
jgi:hypothetical protein